MRSKIPTESEKRQPASSGSSDVGELIRADDFLPSEKWLLENPAALASVARGLDQASRVALSLDPPDIDADAAIVDQIADE